jgi:hypothetical protein
VSDKIQPWAPLLRLWLAKNRLRPSVLDEVLAILSNPAAKEHSDLVRDFILALKDSPPDQWHNFKALVPPVATEEEAVTLDMVFLYPDLLKCDAATSAHPLFRTELLSSALRAAEKMRFFAKMIQDIAVLSLCWNVIGRVHCLTGRSDAQHHALLEEASAFRQLYERSPDIWMNDLCASISDVARSFSNASDYRSACAWGAKAASLRQKQFESDPLAFGSRCAHLWQTLGYLQTKLNDSEAVAQSFSNGLEAARKFSALHPDDGPYTLANALYCAARFSDLPDDRLELASVRLDAASHLLDFDSEGNDTVELQLLANILDVLALVQSRLFQNERAFETIDFAVPIRRKLAESDPSEYDGDLANTLRNQSILQRRMLRPKEVEAELLAEAWELENLAPTSNGHPLPVHSAPEWVEHCRRFFVLRDPADLDRAEACCEEESIL